MKQLPWPIHANPEELFLETPANLISSVSTYFEFVSRANLYYFDHSQAVTRHLFASLEPQRALGAINGVAADASGNVYISSSSPGAGLASLVAFSNWIHLGP